MRTTGIIAISGVFVLLMVATGRSQDAAGRQPFAGQAITLESAASKSNGTEGTPQPKPAAPSPAAPTKTNDPTLRSEYLKLLQTQAELMDEVTLKQEIEQTQRNINELRALQKLQEAQQLLLNITAEFPRTDAATKAMRMLDALGPVGSQAIFPDDVGPGLNTAAEETPFRRSAMSRTFLPRPVAKSAGPGPGHTDAPDIEPIRVEPQD
ncbi:MAG: hypothetical protein R3C59_03060 [Planctomycetaceae bacterium]